MSILTWEQLKDRRDILGRIDWELTPGQAFEAFQIKGAEGWRHRSLGEAYYFYLSVWRGERRVYLVRRGIKESEVIAEAPVPTQLLEDLAAEAAGQDMPRGQIAINQAVGQWLRRELRG